MKIWHISDTHAHHHLLEIPEKLDMVIFSGDCSNYRDHYKNLPEARDFLNWFAALPIKFKIFVAGNHDSSIEKGLINLEFFKAKNITYLENDFVVVQNHVKSFKIWGSPFSPTFGNWSFMKSRTKLNYVWKQIPDDTDIVITHTPPKGILDLTEDRYHTLEQCGCSALAKRLLDVKPKLHCFGHIHNTGAIKNAGIVRLSGMRTIFSNGSVVTDRKFGELSSHGNVFEL